jgi:RNA polymerase sigma-70 factor (ECF subfamily)
LASYRYSKLTDVELQALCQKGDTRAFKELYERHDEALLAYVGHLFDQQQQAEDIVLETMNKLFLELSKKKKQISNVQAWLRRVAGNRVIDILRSNNYRKQVFYDEVFALSLEEEQKIVEKSQKEEQMEVLISEIYRLKHEYKQVIVQRFIYGKSVPEISSTLNLPIPEVYKLLKGAKKILKNRCLDHRSPEE